MHFLIIFCPTEWECVASRSRIYEGKLLALPIVCDVSAYLPSFEALGEWFPSALFARQCSGMRGASRHVSAGRPLHCKAARWPDPLRPTREHRAIGCYALRLACMGISASEVDICGHNRGWENHETT